MSRKAFRAAARAQKKQAVEFEIGDEAFSVQGPIDGMTLLDFAASSEGEGQGASACLDFLIAVLGDDISRFRTAIKAEAIDIEEVMEVVTYIIEEATGKDSQQSASLPSSSPSTSNLSQAAAISVA